MFVHDALSDYLRAGPQRLCDAQCLLAHRATEGGGVGERHRHLRGATYLAGYAVECALKAYIIERTPSARTFTEAVACRARDGEDVDFSGARAHNLRLS